MKNFISFILSFFFYILRMREQPRLLVSLALLVIANGCVILGGYCLGWTFRQILFLYWAESGVIGIYQILKILLAGFFSETPSTKASPIPGVVFPLFLAGFFIIHFGGFMLIHLVFLIVGFGMDPGFVSHLYEATDFLKGPWIPLMTLFLSHGYSFYAHFLKEKKFRTTSAEAHFLSPYGRIVLMHLTIIIGAFVMKGRTAVSPDALAVWVAAKTAADALAHVLLYRARTRKAGGGEGTES